METEQRFRKELPITGTFLHILLRPIIAEGLQHIHGPMIISGVALLIM